MAILEVKNIKKGFGSTDVLKGVSFDVKIGDFLSLLGPSGCGKTTILRIICGLETADEGEVLVDGADLHNTVKNVRVTSTDGDVLYGEIEE